MSTPDIKAGPQPLPEPVPKRAFPIRALLIGFGLALLIGAVAVLSLRDAGADAAIPNGQSSLLILAPAAFLAGIFSFLSPCTLPILPAYFAFTFQARRDRVVLMTVAFFLGLATTLVAVGASATALSQVLFRNLNALTTIGGLIIIAFGIMSILGKGFTGANCLIARPPAWPVHISTARRSRLAGPHVWARFWARC